MSTKPVIADMQCKTYGTAHGLWQYDYGQILRIQGLNLPTAVEIHFSLRETGGESVTRVGVTRDGVTDVVIPDSMLENGNITSDYYIYAFIYLTNESSGETTHKIRMKVQTRPRPEAFDAPEDAELFRGAIAAVNEAADRAGVSEENAAVSEQKTEEHLEAVDVLAKQVAENTAKVEELTQKTEMYAGAAKRGVQADMSVNDENDPAYVKNRTHWIDGEVIHKLPEVFLPESVVTQIEKNKNNISKLSGEIADLKGGNNSSIEPMEDDIPKVFIDGVIPTTKDDVLAEMTYISKTDQFHAYLKIKCQGSSSMSYSKKNFTIKMYSDEARETKLKKAFKDWGSEQNKYVLKANYIDHSHARNIVSARLWSEVVASRSDYESLPTELKTSPNNGAVDGFPIKLYANGTYQGIYTWNIGKDDWFWGMNEDNPNHILLCAESNTNDTFAETSCNFRKLWNGNESAWEVEVGTNSDVLKQGLNNLISCVKDTDDETFVATIGNCLDLQSAIDYWIHQYVICGIDGLAKNMLLGTYNLQTEIETNQLMKYPYSKGTTEENGLFFEDAGDGSILINGVNNDSDSYFPFYENLDGKRLLLGAGIYTISIDMDFDSSSYVSFVCVYADGTKQVIMLKKTKTYETFTLEQDVEVFCNLCVPKDVSIENGRMTIMLNTGSTPLSFEQYTDISPKWIMGAYDMDSTFGLYWDGSKFVSAEYRCPEDYQEKYNLLFERITELYAERVKERYTELRNTVYSFSNLFNHFERFMDVIGKDLYAEDLEIYDIPNGDTNNIKQIRDYIRDRLAYCDSQFGVIEENEIIYKLAQPMVFDGTSTYLDTGLQLFSEPKDSTIFIDFESADAQSETNEAMLMISCSEENTNKSDVRIHKAPTNNFVTFKTNSVEPIIEDVVDNSWGHSWANVRKIALVFKDGLFEYGKYYGLNNTQPRYLEKKDGEVFSENNASLIIGARASYYTPGTYLDFWKGTVNDFRVYNRALSEEEVNALILSY